MPEIKINKRSVDKLGRFFALLFNRAIMYGLNHPFSKQSLGDFFNTIKQELKKYSPIVLIMHQDAFFVEDEPLDSRINTSKMLNHFKKGGIQSVSFEDGLTKKELEQFLGVFTDLPHYPNAEVMKEYCEKERITKVKINHVFFKKVTADDEVLSRDEVKAVAEKKQEEKYKSLKKDLLDMISGGLALEDLGKSLPVTQLLEKPQAVSQYLNAPPDDTLRVDSQGSSSPAGIVMFENIQRIRSEVDKASDGINGAGLYDLALSVARMRDELIQGIVDRKNGGVVYDNEDQIMDEARSLTDKVLLDLVKDEYKQGATTVKRLAQVLRRLIPDNDDLQRLLPKLKEVLLLEGMPLSDFLLLTEEIEKEISSLSIAGSLKKSAEGIGVSGEELLNEITSNPAEAAELIYLAAELRKETGDKKALTEILVNYIERISGNSAVSEINRDEDAGTAHLKSILCNVEADILERLRAKNMDTGMIDDVAKNLNARMDRFMEKLEVDFAKRQSAFGTWDSETTSLMRLFEENLGGSEHVKTLLKAVRDKFMGNTNGDLRIEDIRFDLEETENKISETASEESSKKQSLPKGVHSRKSILYFIEKEIFRAKRYKTPFSLLTISIMKAVPQKKFAPGTVTREEITFMALEKIAQLIRDTDLVGLLDTQRIVSILPMTNEIDAKLALRRLLKNIHSTMIRVNDVPLDVRFAGAVTPFNTSSSISLKEFVRKAEHDIYEMVQRIKNLQTLY